MGKLGDYLREVREAQKLTLKDAAEATAVRQHVLELLEHCKYSVLPSYVHVHGFLLQYSNFLGIDFQNTIKPLLDEECQKENFGKTKEEIDLENEAKQPSIAPSFPVAQVVGFLVVALIIALVGYVIYANGLSSKRMAIKANAQGNQERSYSTEPPAVVAVTPINELPEVLPLLDNKTNREADNISLARADNAAPRTASADTLLQTVIFRFSDECWYHFMADNDNTTSIDLIASAGGTRTMQFKKFFRLDIGNAGGISMQHNGKNYTGFGALRQPIKNIYFRVDENGILQQSRTPPSGS
jgi:cytoskeletal protein RodZ